MPRKTHRKIITSAENLKLINPENMKLVERFLKDKSSKTSALTISNYKSDAEIFFTWNLLYNGNKHFTEIKKLEFSDFFSYATDENELGWGSARANRVRSFISSFSTFIEKFYDEEFPNFRSVVLKVVESMPKETRREKIILTDSEIEDLLSWLSVENKQIACWLALAVCSGSRFSELLRFTLDNIDINNTAFENIFIETKKPIKTKGRGKSGKLLYKYILRERFLPYYQAWLDERKNYNPQTNDLFIKEDGSPITEGIVRGWVKIMETRLGKPLYPHALRHYLCTLLSRKNIPAMLIKDLFGWEGLAMVSVYDDSTAKDKKWEGLEELKTHLTNE